MFKLQPNPKFWAKVEYREPGSARASTFEVEFKHLGKEGIAKYFESIAGKTDAEALLDLITDWRGVDGNFSEETFAQFLNDWPGMSLCLFDTFRRELMEGGRKN